MSDCECFCHTPWNFDHKKDGYNLLSIKANASEQFVVCSECSFPLIKMENISFFSRAHLFVKTRKLKKTRKNKINCRGCNRNFRVWINNSFTVFKLDKLHCMSMNHSYTCWTSGCSPEGLINQFPYGSPATKQTVDADEWEEPEAETVEKKAIDDGWNDDDKAAMPEKKMQVVDEEDW